MWMPEKGFQEGAPTKKASQQMQQLPPTCNLLRNWASTKLHLLLMPCCCYCWCCSKGRKHYLSSLLWMYRCKSSFHGFVTQPLKTSPVQDFPFVFEAAHRCAPSPIKTSHWATLWKVPWRPEDTPHALQLHTVAIEREATASVTAVQKHHKRQRHHQQYH